MAIYQSDVILKNSPKSVHGDAQEAQHKVGTVALNVAVATTDTIQLVYLPAWARVIGAEIDASQIDTNGTPTLSFKVGDNGFTGLPQPNFPTGVVAADLTRYFSTTTIGRVAGPADANASFSVNGRAQNFFNAQPAPLLIVATPTAVAATFAAGTLRFRISYFIDEPASALNQ